MLYAFVSLSPPPFFAHRCPSAAELPSLASPCPARRGTSVHFLSVYFFSVYTRSTSVEFRRTLLSSNFWRRQRHPFFLSTPKKKRQTCSLNPPRLTFFFSRPKIDPLISYRKFIKSPAGRVRREHDGEFFFCGGGSSSPWGD